MKITTATYRKSARKAEEQGRYALAAAYYKLAIDNYPSRGGQLDQADLKLLNDLEEWICEVGISDLYSHPGGAFVIVPGNAEPAFDIVLTERELDSYIANRWPGAELEEFVFSEEPEASEDEMVAGVLLDGECVARVYTGTGL